MKPYKEAFWLTGRRGNNAFAFEARGPDPRLFVPPLLEGSVEEVALGTEVVFSDFDEHGQLQTCTGLQSMVRFAWQGIPVVVMDNHNHAFYFWWELLCGGGSATLIHVDQHKDMRTPEHLFTGSTAEEAFEYTQYGLNVGNYIVPAQACGLVKNIHLVTSQMALEEAFIPPPGPLLLNVDLDFFAPELDYISFGLAREKIWAWGERATLITVATSPFFIDQARALTFLRRLFG